MGAMASARYARLLRSEQTESEHLLWQRLRRRQLGGFRFLRQPPLGRYVCDFACLERRLIIELDGGQHPLQFAEDREREIWLRAQGFRVLRFRYHQLLQDMEAVLQRILSVLEGEG